MRADSFASPQHTALQRTASGELPGIEALRALAALMVMASHFVGHLSPTGLGWWSLATTGVDLFFVLSGFVFARVWVQPIRHLPAFLLRRVARVYPLYCVALLAYALLSAAPQPWIAVPAHLLMLHTTDLATATAYNVAFWSLPPEMQFYLLLPLIGWCAHRYGTARDAKGMGAALLFALTLALLIKGLLVFTASPQEAPDSLRRILTIHLPGVALEFFLGMAAAWACGRLHPERTAWAQSPTVRRGCGALAAVLGVALVGLTEQHLLTSAQQVQAPLWLQGTVGAWAAGVYTLALIASAGVWGLLPQSPPLSFIIRCLAAVGHWSFGIYLLHNAAPALMAQVWPEGPVEWRIALSVPLVLFAAWACHHGIEAPCRTWARRRAQAWERDLPPIER